MAYLRQTFWPTGLACIYPYPPEALAGSRSWQPSVIGAGVLLIAITGVSLSCCRRWPWLIAGWGWYLVTLVPVIGLVQVGQQSRADRYTYLPAVGITWVAAWFLALAMARGGRFVRGLLIALAGMSVVALAVLTARQVAVWRDDVALFEQAVAVTGPNVIGERNLGASYLRRRPRRTGAGTLAQVTGNGCQQFGLPEPGAGL